MIVVGLAGGSGSGKTTIARCLSERLSGYRVEHIDGDGVAHTLLAKDADVIRRVRDRFGDRVVTGGAIDRRKLGAIVFGDEEALADLNAIIHPSVVAVCRGQIEAFELEGVEVVVVDAALLLEVPDAVRAIGIDHTIALAVTRAEQHRRLLAKGGVTVSDIEARLDSQAELEKSFYRADNVVDTNRPLSDVVDDVMTIVDNLLRGRQAEQPGE
ncbi:MAG: dephospho-CoA kinase [Candidatus Latescibacterota bacterium]|nr:MAG: dephospho-CoA kinase [Candidatus Latescibacterota bacterium]